MSKALRVPEYLEHILSAIKRIERHVADVDEFGFLQSELLQDAVVRNIEVIGEAANNIQRADENLRAFLLCLTIQLDSLGTPSLMERTWRY